MQFMYDSIGSGNFVISVFLDFKKTFGTVYHKKIIIKIRGFSHGWFTSYHSERSQIILIDAITSSSSSISYGVHNGMSLYM